MKKRNTIQKKLVLEHAIKLSDHPSAEEVYKSVSDSYPGISKATVYRNLHTLCDEGHLNKLKDPGGADRYDIETDGHFHAVCRKCGKFIDLGPDVKVTVDYGTKSIKDNDISGYSVLFEGLCGHCSN